MAYKFFQGPFKTNGALDVNNALTGNAILVDTGGITVSTGASSLQELTASSLKVDNTLLNGDILSGLTQLSASNLSASSAQFGTIAVSALSAPNLDLSGYLDVKGASRLSGTVLLGDASSDIITVGGQLTASVGLSASAGIFNTVMINGGGIDNTAIGAAIQSSGKFTTLSSSAGLQVGTNALIGGTVTVGGATVLNSSLYVSGAVTLNNGDTDLVKVSGSTSSDIFLVSADVDLLKVSKTNGVQVFGALSGSSTVQAGGNATIGGTLAVNGGGTSTFANRVNLGADGGSISLSGSGAAQLGGGLTVAGTSILNGNLTVNGTATFPNTVTIKDLYVTGTMTAVQSTNLNVADAKVVIASGSTTTGSFDTLDPAGLYVGGSGGDGADAFGSLTLNHNAGAWTWQVFASGAIDPTLQVGGGSGGSVKIGSTSVLSQTQLFAGAVTGSSAGVGLKLKYITASGSYTPSLSEYVIGVDTTSIATTINLPAPVTGDIGRVLLIKDISNNASVNNITVAPNGTDTIDGTNASFKLESNSAAVHCIVIAANKWGLF